eukprot:g17065.t1
MPAAMLDFGMPEKLLDSGQPDSVSFRDLASPHSEGSKYARSSFTNGCHGSVTNQFECCALCAQYWPLCQSWVWVKQSIGSNFPEENLRSDQNEINPYTICISFIGGAKLIDSIGGGSSALKSVCCLKTQFRPNPRTSDAETGQQFFFLISGFFNQRCAITADCKIRAYTRSAVSGHTFTENDKYLVINYEDECGSPNVTYSTSLPAGTNDTLGNPIVPGSNIVPGVTTPSWGSSMPNYGTNATAGVGSYSYTYTGAGIVVFTLEEQEVNLGTYSVGEVAEYKVCYSTTGGGSFADYDKTMGTLTMKSQEGKL